MKCLGACGLEGGLVKLPLCQDDEYNMNYEICIFGSVIEISTRSYFQMKVVKKSKEANTLWCTCRGRRFSSVFHNTRHCFFFFFFFGLMQSILFLANNIPCRICYELIIQLVSSLHCFTNMVVYLCWDLEFNSFS